MRTAHWPLLFLLLAASNLHADESPVARGPSREPLPYRYDPAVLKSIPKDVLDDASACVLYSATTHLLSPDGTDEAISHEITRLHSRKGIERLGEYRSIYYDPTCEKLTLNVARVIKADGTIVPIEDRHLQLRDIGTDYQIYDHSKQLVVSFPNLQVGDIYEVKWTVRGKSKEFDGQFFSRYTFGDDQLPVLRDEFRVRVPKNKTLRHATINGKVDLVVTQSAESTLYHWTATDRRALPRDEERPSREELRLQVAVSTFPSWDAVGQWKQSLRKDCWTCTPELRKVVAEVTRGQTTQTEKAKALTYWVRRHVRYHSRGPGGLGYTPHQPHQVLANLYGDCKDQAQLLAVMLREIGLPVWLVTLGAQDDGQVLKDVPSPWGSHAILLTQIDGKEHWIDTTVSLAAWDFLPRPDRDRQVYATRDAALKLMRTPTFAARDNRIEQVTHVTVRPDGTSVCRRESTYHENAAWTKRERWLEVPPGERRRGVTAELQDAHPKARLLALKIDEKQLLDFDRPVRSEIEFEIPGHFTGETTRDAHFSDSPVWTWLLGYNLDVERELPYVLPTPLESMHRYVITLPPAFHLDILPQNKNVASRWGTFKLNVKHDAKTPGRLELHMHTQLEKVRVETSEFAEFQKFQEDVTKAYRVWLSIRPTTNIADAPALEKHLAAAKDGDLHTAKVLARIYLDYERADAARKVLDQAAARFPDDSALWELRVSASANVTEEERLYREMVKRFADEPRYAVALGAALVRREDHAEAKKVLTPLTNHTQGPVRAAANYQLARSAYRQDNAALALKHVQAALLADSNTLASVDALHFKARVHEKLGQTREAMQSLEAAAEGDPNAREVLEYLIRLELKDGLKDKALDHLRRYTIAAGKDAASLIRAAELHLDLGRFEEALELAGRAQGDSKAQRLLGLAHAARGEHARAAPHLERGDLDARALTALLHAHLRAGDLDAALRRTDLARKIGKEDKELILLEKRTTLLTQRRAALLAAWKVSADKQVAAARAVGRYVCAERGVDEGWPRADIERLLGEALPEDLRFAPALALRGWLFLEAGQFRKALADADESIMLQSGQSRAHLVRGRVWLEQGKIDAALGDLRRATEFSRREDPVVLHWLAAALADAGRKTEAIDTQRLALLLRPDDALLLEQMRRLESKR